MSNAQEVIFIVALLSTIYQFSYNQKLSQALLNERSFSLGLQPFNRKLPNLQLVMAVEGKTQYSTPPTSLLGSKDISDLGFIKKTKQLWNPGLATCFNHVVESSFNLQCVFNLPTFCYQVLNSSWV